MFEWSVTWNLNFSQSKYCYIQVGPPSRSCHHSCMLNSTVITSTDKQKDFGIWIDPNLSFHSHTHYTVSRANRILGLISKCFRYLDSTMMLSLYKTIVCPIVEYGNVIWGPHFALDQQSIEKIQRRATKLISTLHHVPYTDRLALLKLPSLQYRRWRGDTILMYPYLLSDLAIHFPPPEAINIRFLSIQFITMLEPTFLPAELPTSGMIYHQKLLKLHH